MTTELNNPDTRQSILAERAKNGGQLVALDLAQEFDISLDTIRRDILALEDAGLVRRVRGGAVPIAKPVAPLRARSVHKNPGITPIVRQALFHIEDGMAVVLDGGTTVLALAQLMGEKPNCLIVTPAPLVADATSALGLETMLVGGKVSPYGGISVGAMAEDTLGNIAADMCFLGACALHPKFGLSSDQFEESSLKTAMANAANRTIVLTTKEKLDTRSRHKTLATTDIDLLITDTEQGRASDFAKAGVVVEYV
ncbi:DeoR/GlpR family DNA-binding transcription regulator [Maritalea sp.]|uniref:DeoR/GlpR family DNA-binding transcription regulator n=1 Tax=Maritalea sp. TaxID=2003361 RepID=UPI003EF1C0F9